MNSVDSSDSARLVLDVSKLPDNAEDHRSPIWWGNLLLLFIETTMFGLLLASYFYVRQNFNLWPPPSVSGPFALLRPVPTLRLPLIELGVISLSLVPMIWADYAALHRKTFASTIAVTLSVAFGGAAIWLRFYEFPSLNCRWDDNAYASIIWTLLGMHLLHLIVGTAENFIMLLWLLVHGMDAKHARDIRVTAVYWYWIVGIWWILFAVVYFAPRLWPQGSL